MEERAKNDGPNYSEVLKFRTKHNLGQPLLSINSSPDIRQEQHPVPNIIIIIAIIILLLFILKVGHLFTTL